MEEIIIDTNYKRLYFPNLTIQINEINYGPEEEQKCNVRQRIPIITKEKREL